MVSGASSWFLRAHAGYDGVTGLGSPKVPQVIAALVGATATASTTVTTHAVTTTTSAKTARSTVATPTVAASSAPQFAAPAGQAVSMGGSSGVFASSNSLIAVALMSLREIPLASFDSTTLAANGVLGGSGGGRAAESMLAVIAQNTAQALPLGTAQTITHGMSMAVTNTAAAVADVASEGLPALQAAIVIAPQLRPLNALAAFTDAIAAFAHESAAFGGTFASGPHHRLAWGVTFSVLAADVILIANWWGTRKQKRGAVAFSVTQI